MSMTCKMLKRTEIGETEEEEISTEVFFKNIRVNTHEDGEFCDIFFEPEDLNSSGGILLVSKEDIEEKRRKTGYSQRTRELINLVVKNMNTMKEEDFSGLREECVEFHCY